MSGHCAGNCVEKGRPSTTGFEFLVGGIQRRITGGTVVGTGLRVMLVIFATEWRFGSLLSDDAELLYSTLAACWQGSKEATYLD
jgi:hypothetical protein